MFPASEGILSTGPLDGSGVELVEYANQITQTQIDAFKLASRFHWPVEA